MFRMTTSELPCEISVLGNSDIGTMQLNRKASNFILILSSLNVIQSFTGKLIHVHNFVSDKFMKNVQSRIHVYTIKIHETLLLYLAHYPYIYLFNDLKFQTPTFEYC